MVACFVYGCKHRSEHKSCSFFRFPKTKRVSWGNLCRRSDREATQPNDRICSCHFKDGDKSKDPEIFPCNEGQRFDYTLAESRTSKRKKIVKCEQFVEDRDDLEKDVMKSSADYGNTCGTGQDVEDRDDLEKDEMASSAGYGYACDTNQDNIAEHVYTVKCTAKCEERYAQLYIEKLKMQKEIRGLKEEIESLKLKEETRSTFSGYNGGERGAFENREFCKIVIKNELAEKDTEIDKNDLIEVARAKQDISPRFEGTDDYLASCEHSTHIENGNVHIRVNKNAKSTYSLLNNKEYLPVGKTKRFEKTEMNNSLNNQESSSQPKSVSILQSILGGKLNSDRTTVVCGKSYRRKKLLEAHKRTHTGELPFSYKETDQGKVLYSCNVCDKIFPDLKKVTIHSKTHGERRFGCETCGKYFLLEALLREHKRTHTGEKPFTCEYCGKAFAKSSNLYAHRRYHTGIKPFACPTCDKKFSQKPHLDTHIRIHTGEKPFMCDRCSWGFSSSSGLKRHSLTHLGIKNHKCETCGKAFVRRSGLLQHHRVHTRDIEKGRLKPMKEKEKNEISNYVVQGNASTTDQSIP